MTYFFADGDAILLMTDRSGWPQSFEWNKKLHIVSDIVSRWIVDDSWWIERTWRDYYLVATDTGLLAVIFHDLVHEHWYIQRLYD